MSTEDRFWIFFWLIAGSVVLSVSGVIYAYNVKNCSQCHG